MAGIDFTRLNDKAYVSTGYFQHQNDPSSAEFRIFEKAAKNLKLFSPSYWDLSPVRGMGTRFVEPKFAPQGLLGCPDMQRSIYGS